MGRVTRTASVLIVPGSPALVAELGRGDAASRELERAARAAAAGDIRPVDIVCDMGPDTFTARTGTFAAWGAPQVDVGGGNHLGELVARYLLGPREYRPARARVAPLDPSALTVVVADGPAGLTARAPLAFVPGDPAAHEALRRFVATGRGFVRGGVDKHMLWEELSLLDVTQAHLIASDDTLGVGRYVGAWEVAL